MRPLTYSSTGQTVLISIALADQLQAADALQQVPHCPQAMFMDQLWPMPSGNACPVVARPLQGGLSQP